MRLSIDVFIAVIFMTSVEYIFESEFKTAANRFHLLAMLLMSMITIGWGGEF